MAIREVSESDLRSKLGARITKMSPHVRALVLGGQSTLAIEGITYRAVSDEQAKLVHKSATPRIAAELAPEPEKRRDLAEEIRADIARERGPSAPLKPWTATAEKPKPTAMRAVPETSQELRIRIQREADKRRAATQGKRPGSKLADFLDGNDPEAA